MAGFAKNVIGKFDGMRKEQKFTLYPNKREGMIMIQSDKSIGLIDPDTGKGRFYKGKGEHPGFIMMAFAKDIQYPADFTAAVKASFEATYGVHGVEGPIQITGMPVSGNAPVMTIKQPSSLSPSLDK